MSCHENVSFALLHPDHRIRMLRQFAFTPNLFHYTKWSCYQLWYVLGKKHAKMCVYNFAPVDKNKLFRTR